MNNQDQNTYSPYDEMLAEIMAPVTSVAEPVMSAVSSARDTKNKFLNSLILDVDSEDEEATKDFGDLFAQKTKVKLAKAFFGFGG